MAFIATVVALAVTLHVWAHIPQMRASTYVTLHSVLLGRKAPRPLRLMVRSVIRLSPLLVPCLGPRWSTYPLRLLWALTFYFIFHLFHNSGFLHQCAKSLMDNGATINRISPRRPFSNFWHLYSSLGGKV